MKKVLHIQGHALQHASLDGKALKITLSGQSPLRFPLTRISRITISGRCNVPIEVFIYCVTRQIPVTFFDGHGHIRGQLLPHLRQPEPLGFYLEQLPYHSGFKTVYALWLDNQRRHILKQVGMENGVPKLRAKQFHDAVVLMMKTMHCKDAFNQGIAWLLGFYRAHLNQIFHNAGP
ncbi:CRISPR-associated endonuclease Cas1 [uncultured Photobacterium sp.]|uniref:CRISPR-associated endonuclease Cas1 n=1 Tax=uncultured Photobacterium sp. TaxID=173973 RepID=UPI0026154241|nr:CRISPR-associated endonuclease Cas1 [uncultured Photobacterium sp.]